MKNSSLAVAALLGALATTTAAQAQSSVTLFGVVDVNVRHVRNGDTATWQLGTDGYAASRFGFRGTEDLGGRLKAGFWLESALNADSGTVNATRFFHRRSIVSLQGGFGEVRFGRDLVPTFSGFADYDAFGAVGVGDMNKLYTVLGSVADTQVRADNAVSYLTPELGGPFAQVTVAPGEGTLGRKYAGGRVGWRDRNLSVSASYGQTQVTAANDRFELGILGALVDFGVVRLMGVVSDSRYLAARERHYSVGAHVPVLGALGQIRASYTRIQGRGSRDGSDGDQVALGYVHNLSKSTALYGTAARIRNRGQLVNLVASTPALPPGSPAGPTSTGVEAGIRVSF